jgi:hypothetical protein
MYRTIFSKRFAGNFEKLNDLEVVYHQYISAITKLITMQTSVKLMLRTCTQEVHSSNLRSDTSYPGLEHFVIFLNPQGKCKIIPQVRTASFHILSYLLIN